ncbi:hypothetical protein E2C01_038479 [Portunus trituberculatus]|uniref:Uncharacterized protein n=1 Tax=Portunus trituberculatus TaxID=210409 RepID=A0A5B7FI17_PORTR|nr:hypothetical protein [Portunus trituberculatus]
MLNTCRKKVCSRRKQSFLTTRPLGSGLNLFTPRTNVGGTFPFIPAAAVSTNLLSKSEVPSPNRRSDVVHESVELHHRCVMPDGEASFLRVADFEFTI